MPEISKQENTLNWICRLLMLIGMAIVLSGYLSWFQVRSQLVSPLIPGNMTVEIFMDGGDIVFKTSLIAGIIFLLGVLAFSFGKKMLATLLFASILLLFLAKGVIFKM